MIYIKDLIKDRESINKYVSRIIHAKIGNSQLVMTNTTENESSTTETWNKSKIIQDVQHLKKVLTTDKRILEVEDFPEINEKMFSEGYSVPKTALIFNISNEDNNDLDFDIYETYSNVLQIEPFRLKLDLKSAIDENDPVYILYTDSEITTDCWVYWNGATYLAYTIDIASPDINFAHRARDILRDIYKDSELLNIAIVGPCPIHTDINIYIFSKEKLSGNFAAADIADISLEPIVIDDDIIVSVLLDTEDKVTSSIHKIATAIFWELHLHLENFYRAMTTRTLLLRTTDTCLRQFEELSNCLLSIHGLPGRAFFKKSRKIKELGVLTAKINMILSKEYKLNIELKDEQKYLITSSKNHPIKSLLIDYFQEHTTESECIDRQSISNALVNADQVLSRHTVFNVQLISAIIGGIIGGITAVALIYLSAFLSNLNTP